MRHLLYRNKFRSSQQGVVLALALIFLAVISLVSIYTLRSTITGEQISKNLRTSTVAMQSAESALRLCEDAVRTGQATLGTGTSAVAFIKNSTPEALPNGEMPEQWKTRANWVTDSTSIATQIPASLITDANMRPMSRPRCMVEQYELPIMSDDRTLTQPYLITTVGYSPDYVADTNGNAIAGSEVWLQSVFRP